MLNFHPIIVAAGQLKIIYFRNRVPHTSLHILVHGSIESTQPEAEFEVAQFVFLICVHSFQEAVAIFSAPILSLILCTEFIIFFSPVSFLF